MKKFFLLVISAFFALAVFAQTAADIIVTSDSRKIEAKIIEVSKSEVKYKEASYLDGPTFVLSADEISSIIYANGTVTAFEHDSKGKKSSSSSSFGKDGKKRNLYQGYTELSGNIGSFYNDYYEQRSLVGVVSLTDIYGCRFNEHTFLGAGFGVSGLFCKMDGAFIGSLYSPLFADFRAYIPTSVEGMYPMFGVSVGPQFKYYEFGEGRHVAKFDIMAYSRVYAGFDYKRFTMGIGYELWANEDFKQHFGFIKIGMRLGKQNIY